MELVKKHAQTFIALCATGGCLLLPGPAAGESCRGTALSACLHSCGSALLFSSLFSVPDKVGKVTRGLLVGTWELVGGAEQLCHPSLSAGGHVLESIQSKGSFIVSLGRPCSVSGARSPSARLLVREAQGNSLVKLTAVMLNLFSIALLLFLPAKLETLLCPH